MPRTARQILRSNDGASIIMALFLFLVCAALSAVILAAGTASAGRVSGLAAADQKYYSATSAAELLSEMMSDSDVSTQVVVKRTTTTTRVNGRTTGTTVEDPTCTVDGEPVGDLSGQGPLAQSVAFDLLDAWRNAGNNLWDWNPESTASDPIATLDERTLSLSHAPGERLSATAKKLLSDQDVSIKAAIQSNGDLVMTLESTATAQGAGNTRNTADQPYVLQLTCKANIVTETSTSTSHSASEGTVTRTDTKTTTITWQPAGIKTLSSSLEEEGA